MKRKKSQKVVVKDSRYGQGVFSTRRFEFDEVVGRVRGQLTSEEELDPRYSMEMDDEQYIIPGAPFRFLNHSCSPNCELFMYDDDDKEEATGSRPLYVGTTRKIGKGDELTIDYGWPAFFAIPCGCESDDCRGWIVDEDEVDQVGPE